MVKVLDKAYEHSELVLEAGDEEILDRVWARFREKHPNYRSSAEELERVRTLSERRKALYESLPSPEERARRRAAVRALRP